MKTIIAAMFMMVAVSCSPAHADEVEEAKRKACKSLSYVAEGVMTLRSIGKSQYKVVSNISDNTSYNYVSRIAKIVYSQPLYVGGELNVTGAVVEVYDDCLNNINLYK